MLELYTAQASSIGVARPTIVVPGPWTRADIDSQAGRIVTAPLQTQVLLLPADWEHTPALRRALREWINVVVELPVQNGESVDPYLTCASTLYEQLLGGVDAEAFLRRAIDFANSSLPGTARATILVHPATMAALGPRWDEQLRQLRHGVTVHALPRRSWFKRMLPAFFGQ